MYSSQDDLLLIAPSGAIAQLTDDVSGLTIGSSTVTRAIVQADSLINSYLRGGHTVPITPVPTEVRDCSAFLALCALYERRPSSFINGLPPVLDVRRSEWVKWLEGVRDGKNMIDNTASDANTGAFLVNAKASTDKVFTSTVLDTYT